MEAEKVQDSAENGKNQPKKNSLKHRKIRRLAKDKVHHDKLQKATPATTLKKRMLALIVILVTTAVYCAFQYKLIYGSNPFRDFIRSYNKHYYQLVHDKPNYCDHDWDIARWLQPTRDNVVFHQTAAIAEFERALQNRSNIQRIAVTGASGVGKTLFTTALVQTFPYAQNARAFAWNAYTPPTVNKLDILRGFVEDFSECGSNLLVLDSLRVEDREVVDYMNNLLGNMTDATRKHVIVVYVFHLNSMLDDRGFDEQFEQLQNLSLTKTVNFKSFGPDEVKDCIRREAALRKYKLDEKGFEEIVASIDAKQSGCKKVYSKMRLYGIRDELA